MAMLIAWQAVNAARKASKDFSRAFLIIAPGITSRDRLRVLLPSEPDNYFETREIVPPEMLPDIRRAEIVITNYHAFQHRETLALPKVARSFLQGNAPKPIRTTETDAEMLERACGKLMRFERVNVINDEAHHCYRHKVGGDEEGKLTAEDRREAAENEEAARLWINGIEALERHLAKGGRGRGVRAVYDLSATPFFLRGSGYPEGYLFPWVVSDFSLMDAIESGIVKLPRVPVSDNLAQTSTVVFRNLWKEIGKDLPKSASAPASSARTICRTCSRPPSMPSTAIMRACSRRGSGPASACRPCSSWCARTPPSPSWCSTGSPAGRPAARASGPASSPAIWSCSAIMTSTAPACRGRARC